MVTEHPGTKWVREVIHFTVNGVEDKTFIP